MGNRRVRIRKKNKESLLSSKLLFSIIIMMTYICGRCIPLYGIDYAAYSDAVIDTDAILLQTIGGDLYKTSIFALGIGPYISGTILVTMVMAIKRVGDKSPVSPKRQGRITMLVILIFAIMQANSQIEKLIFVAQGNELIYAKCIAFIEMVTGALLLMRLANRNKKYGLGGQTAVIIANIIDGITKQLKGNIGPQLVAPLIIGFIALIIMLIMEGTEIRIPVQRISIQSIYSDKNYLPIKSNPVGVMPIMFASAAFMLPQLIVETLAKAFPYKTWLQWLNTQMNLSTMVGIITYIVLLYILTIVFAALMIDPSNLAENFLKTGDSIVNLHAGPPTKKYIYKLLWKVCLFSSTVMAICAGLPMILRYYGLVDASVAMIPTSIMLLAGLYHNLYEEYVATKSFDNYVPFL